jgi:hypothetical protein
VVFLVLFKRGEADADLDVCGVIRGKKADEAEVAIKEAMTEGPGEYIAVPFDPSKILRREAKRAFIVVDPDAPPEEEPPPTPEPEKEPDAQVDP